MKLYYPTINVKKDGKIFISFLLNNKRIRLSSGKRIGKEIYPNSYPKNERVKMAKILCSEVYNYLREGGILDNPNASKNLSELEYLKLALDTKLKQRISRPYKRNNKTLHNQERGYIKD